MLMTHVLRGTFTCETSNTSSSSRSKKKRTFTQLKEEEKLPKGEVHLKRELASIHVTLKEQRAKSDDLKRIKYNPQMASNQCTTDAAWLNHQEPIQFCQDASWMMMTWPYPQLPGLNAMPSEDEIGTL